MKSVTEKQFLIFILILFFIFQIPYIFFPIPLTYDEGVFFATIKLLQSGKSLYTDIFYAHPPLFIILAQLFSSFFKEVTALQLAIPRFLAMTLSLPLVVSLYLLCKKFFNQTAAYFCFILAIFSPGFFLQSHKFSGDVASLSFAMLSLLVLLRENPNIKSIIVSACLFAISLQMKLIAAPLLIPLLYAVNSGFSFKKMSLKYKEIFLFICVFTGVFFSIMYALNCPLLSFSYQLQGGSLAHFWDATYSNVSIKQTVWNKLRLSLLFGAPLSLVYLVAFFWILKTRSKNLLLSNALVWLGASYASILFHSPVWYHHFVLLLPAQVILCCFLFYHLNRRSIHTLLVKRLAILLLLINFSLVTAVGYYVHHSRLKQWHENYDELTLVLKKRLKPNVVVISDEHFLVSKLGFQLLPELVDTSTVRVSTGSLNCEKIKNAVVSQGVSGLVLGERLNRLTHSTGCDVLKFFPIRERFGNVVLYFK